MNDETDKDVRREVTLTEIGLIISLICSVGSFIFTAGIVYGDVKRNTADLAMIKPQVNGIDKRLERIDANVSFLTSLAREENRR